MFYICREMGWDYWTYLAQPKFFIKIIVNALNNESKKLKKNNG